MSSPHIYCPNWPKCGCDADCAAIAAPRRFPWLAVISGGVAFAALAAACAFIAGWQ